MCWSREPLHLLQLRAIRCGKLHQKNRVELSVARICERGLKVSPAGRCNQFLWTEAVRPRRYGEDGISQQIYSAERRGLNVRAEAQKVYLDTHREAQPSLNGP